MKETGLTIDQITGKAAAPIHPVGDVWHYKYGQSLVRPDSIPVEAVNANVQFNNWYMQACKDGQAFLSAKIKHEHYFYGEDLINIEFAELHQLYHQDALDKCLVSSWCL